jgi:putative transposase
MIERAHQTLSIRSQWRLLSISRSPLYYEPRGETGMNLGLMRLIRRPLLGHFKCPVRQRAGECEAIAERGQAIFGNAARRRSPPSRTFCECPAAQRMTWRLRHEGHAASQKRIRRLMRLMRLMPITQKPDTRCPPTHACMCERGQAREGAQDLPISARRAADRAAQPSLVRGHHLPAPSRQIACNRLPVA